MKSRLGIAMALLLLLLAGNRMDSAVGLRVEPYRDLLAVELLVQGLEGPAGLAIEPASGLLHVAERKGNRISVIHDRTAFQALESAFEISSVLPPWALTGERSLEEWTETTLRNPTGVDFDRHGRLWIAEGGQKGRLLRFEPIEEEFAFAQVIVSPWIEDDLGYTSVQVDHRGRMFATMQRVDPHSVLSFGRVLMRDTDGEWFLVDYGPFAEFSNVALSPDRQTLLFAEHRTADVTWYDIDRQMLFGAMERVSGVRHVTVLSDGSMLASLHREDDTWSVIEIDPDYGRIWEWAGGLSEIGGLAAHPDNGDLYVSLSEEGKVMRLYRMEERPRDTRETDKMASLLESFEMEHTLPPKEWPKFFRDFIERLDMVQAVDRIVSTQTPLARSPSSVPMSIEEFTHAIPVVAAKVKATLLSSPEVEPDPITELSFVIFFPNRSIHTRQSVAPSISLFHAEHESGRIARTRFLPNQDGSPLSEDLDWDNMPEVLVSFPSGYHAQRTGLSEEGLLRTYFLGMGLGSDYWIDIHRMERNRSILVVEKPNGTKVEYFLEPYPERPEAGGESILVAGLTDIERGWKHIGNTPVMWNIVLDEEETLSTRNVSRLEQEAWRYLQNRPAVAAAYRPDRLSREEINFRRAIVLRAATRWHKDHF